MKWSWKVGTFRGIAVYVHATFLLLLGYILVSHLLGGFGLGAALRGVLAMVLLFTCVVLHEFGHALTAQRFGIQTRDITLYPIGGVARLERIPRNPQQELLIALAGPAVNVVIAGVLAVVLTLGGAPLLRESFNLTSGNLLRQLMFVNLALVFFNLLPAFPMDGGRVLRALLATRMEYAKATRIAASVGQSMAFLFAMVGLFGNPMLLFIAFFVYMGASEEAATVEAELAFRGVPVSGAMMTQFATLSAADPLSRAIERLLAGAQHDFPVVDTGQVVGLLTRSALIQALGEAGPEGRVGQAMSAAPDPVAPGDSLEETFQRMRESGVQTVPVLANGRLAGLITLENIGEFLMVRSAVEHLRNHRGNSPPPVNPVAAGDQVWQETQPETWLPGPGKRVRG
jgi:Zn-dependent protease/predicted transcriptional regulator